MFASTNIKTILVAAGLLLLAADPSALAQQRLQGPDGRQLVAPSDMPQQPSAAEDYANPTKINERTVPPSTGPDMGGLPGIESPGRKQTQGPGIIQNQDINEN